MGGLLLVFAFFPMYRGIRKRVRSRALAAFVSFLVVGLVVVGPLVLVVFLVFQDAVAFAQTYDPNRLNQTIDRFFDEYGLSRYFGGGPDPSENQTSEVANALGRAIQRFAQRLGEELLAAAPGLAIGLFVTGFVVYYGFVDGENFYRQLRYAIPLPDDIEDSLFREISRVTNVVFVGSILVAVIGGIIGAISLAVFGVPNPVFLGFIMIILGILPVVGAPLVWIPAALWLFIQGHPVKALGLILTNGIIVVGFIDNILRPKLMGVAAHVHPVVVLLGVLGGVQAFGPLGFVIGPLVLAVFIALARSYTEWHPRWRARRLRMIAPMAAVPASTEAPPAASQQGSGTAEEEHHD